MCASQMHSIAFITFRADIHKILAHIGVDSQAPRITPARGPPLWDDCGAQETGEGEALPTTPKTSAQVGEQVWQVWRQPPTGVGLCAWAAWGACCDDSGKFLANQTGDSAYVCFVRPIGVRYLGSCGWNSYP